METHDGAARASGDSTGASVEPQQPSTLGGAEIKALAPEAAASTPDAPPGTGMQPPETEAPTSFDPTPVIRGYITEESDAAINDTQSVPVHTSASSSIADKHVDQEQTAIPVPLNRESNAPVTEPATEETTQVIENPPPAVEKPATVDPFKSRVRSTWSLMFGARYEDEEDDGNGQVHEDVGSKPEEPNSSQPKLQASNSARASSLRSKLDLGRQLDQHLQHGRRARVRQRPGSNSTVDNEKTISTSRSSSQRPRHRPKTDETWLVEENPFHEAGLTPTIVRFCLEKATLSTVHCIAQLHAIAQDEPEPARAHVELGLFLTQWELDTILRSLFESAASSSSSSSSTCHSQMWLHNAEYDKLPLETLLQVSWFMPLDQFSRQRSLVAQISRKHLRERKLAIFNAALHRHFVLRPHPGVKMQRLLLRILENLQPRPTTRHPTGNQADNVETDKEAAKWREESRALVVELLHAIYVRIPPNSSAILLTVQDFMRLTPLELVTTLQLTSVIAVQRIVFFRFSIEALASEKANSSVGVNSWWPRSTGKPSTTSRLHQRRASEAATEYATAPRRSVTKTKKKKQQPDKKVLNTDQHDEQHTELESDAPVQSAHASHGSVGSPRNATPQEAVATHEKTDVATQSDFTKLYQSLTIALAGLVKAQPWLVDEEDHAAPASSSATAMRASFLAAETFQQSLVLLESAGISASASVLLKIQEFTAIINGLTQRRAVAELPPPEYEEPQQPTPRCEATKAIPVPVQRGDSVSSIFPPPYIATTPSYWTFEPQLPAPSTPKDDASIPRSVAKAKASPGVGDYDLARSDRLTSVQRRGFTFAKSGLEPVAESTKTPTPKHKPRAEHFNSNEPPEYTHWASAAIDDDSKTVTTMTERLLPDEDDEDEDHDVETRVREALRMQQSFALDDMVQSLLHRGRPVISTSTNRTKATPRPQSAASQPPSRVVSRVRSAAATTRPQPQPQPPAYTKKAREFKPPAQQIQQPPRDFEPPADDAHLQWAARVSEFYQAKLKAVVASTGSLVG